MKIALVYISPNGTTRITAGRIADRFLQDQHQVAQFDLGSANYRDNHHPILGSLDSFDLVGFGSAVYHMEMLSPMNSFLSKLEDAGTPYNFRAFLFVNYAGITSGKSLLVAAEKLDKAGIPTIGALKLVAPHFHHPEKFPDNHSIRIIEDFCDKLNIPKLEKINKKAFRAKRMVNIVYPFVHAIGKMRELPIKIEHAKCKKCGKCARECPVSAIHKESNVIINSNACIHCYHCVACCPFAAVESPVEKLDKMIAMNKKIIGMEEPQNKIYIEESV